MFDGQSFSHPEEHPYAAALKEIESGITAVGAQGKEASVVVSDEEEDALPFNAELIPRSIAALLGGPQKKMEQAQYLSMLAAQSTDESLKALIHVIQLALFSKDHSQPGRDLMGVYRQAWKAIVVGVESGGVDPGLMLLLTIPLRCLVLPPTNGASGVIISSSYVTNQRPWEIAIWQRYSTRSSDCWMQVAILLDWDMI